MEADPRSVSRLPTGGPSPARAKRKRWWLHLTERVDRTLATIAMYDNLNRQPAAAVVGTDEAVWRSWLAVRGVTTVKSRVELVVAVDAFAPLSAADARTRLADLHRRVAVGGRLLLIERVVRRRGEQGRGIHQFLTTVSRATGGAVTLADVASARRPGEAHPSTVILELVRLASPEDAR